MLYRNRLTAPCYCVIRKTRKLCKTRSLFRLNEYKNRRTREKMWGNWWEMPLEHTPVCVLYPCNTSAVLWGMSTHWCKITDYHVINYNVFRKRMQCSRRNSCFCLNKTAHGAVESEMTSSGLRADNLVLDNYQGQYCFWRIKVNVSTYFFHVSNWKPSSVTLAVFIMRTVFKTG